MVFDLPEVTAEELEEEGRHHGLASDAQLANSFRKQVSRLRPPSPINNNNGHGKKTKGEKGEGTEVGVSRLANTDGQG